MNDDDEIDGLIVLGPSQFSLEEWDIAVSQSSDTGDLPIAKKLQLAIDASLHKGVGSNLYCRGPLLYLNLQ